ncbi:hypothetical protein [Lactiplantibacillus plantarum]|uniref:hypothetical protein n=1 Tax=Lactiplantibacillus plantarum TaxID=1590 RepID=UPI0024B8BABF|nr:hypothetical protein [Lactiplantibacillus plantarum]
MDWLYGEIDGTTDGADPFCNWLVTPSVLRENFTDPTAMSLMVWARMAPNEDPTNNSAIGAIGIIAWDAVSDDEPDPCPGPLTNPERDWMWLWYTPWVANDGTTADSVSHTWECDLQLRSKARRRLGNQTSLLVVAQSLIIPAQVHLHARVLIKE